MLFRGTIELGDAEASSVADVTHSPEPHPRGEGVLRDVKAVYRPAPPTQEGRTP